MHTTLCYLLVGGPHGARPLESGTGLSARMRHFDRRLVRTVHAGARIERLAGRKKDDARVGKAAALGGEIDGCSGTRGGREELAGSEAAAGNSAEVPPEGIVHDAGRLIGAQINRGSREELA